MDLTFFDTVREALTTTVRSSLPEPQASLLLGTILGVKSGFPPDFYEALRITGTLHVVVVSGFNITVIISTLAHLLIFLPLRLRVFVTLLFVTAFVLLVGVNPPVVRAAIMGSIALLGTVLGRQSDALRAFLLAAILMLVFQPNWAGELSFQLSFLATLGLIVVFPLLDRVIPGKNLLRSDFLTTLAAQITVWPLLAFKFGTISLFSPVINTLVLWTIPIITYIGLVTSTIGTVVKGVSVLIMVPVRLFLDYFIGIVGWFASLKIGYWEISPFSAAALVFYFGVLGGGLWLLYQHLTRAQKPA